KPNEGVSDADKTAAGIPLPNPSRSPVEKPTTQPKLDVVAQVTGSQTIQFADVTTPTRRAKPAGVRALYLYCAVADEPVADASQAKFIDAYGKGPIGVPFDHADNGKMATYFACWVSTRNEKGPMSAPVSMTIAA